MSKLTVIARVGNNPKEREIGYRLVDNFTGEVKDVPTQALYNVVKAQPELVTNVEAGVGSVIGTNGDLRRYPMVRVGEQYSSMNILKLPLTVLAKIDNVGFRFCDCYGRILERSNDKFIGMAKQYGLTNGKIVSKDGNVYVSAIHGEYLTINETPLNTSKKFVTDMSGNIGPIEKYYTELLTRNGMNANTAEALAERFIARCIDNDNYSNKETEKAINYITETFPKTGAKMNLCRYFMGNWGAKIAGVQIKKIKNAVRIVNDASNNSKASDFESREAIPADTLTDVLFKCTANGVYALGICRVINGEDNKCVRILDTFKVKDSGNKAVAEFVKVDVKMAQVKDTGKKKKVNKTRWEGIMKFM